MKYKLLALAMTFCYLFSSVSVLAATDTQETASTAVSADTKTREEQGILTESDRGCTISVDSNDSLELVSEGAILIEASTGAVLYSKNPEQTYYPASITKVMTTLVALENSSLTDQITYSADTLNSIEQDSSRVGVEADETMTMEDALYCVMLASGNDTAAGVAEHVGGTVSKFVDMMNEKAKELGCTNTHFMNPHGLHNEDHYVCAKDMALIVQAAIQNPDFCKIASAKSHTVAKTNKSEERELWNHHKMLLPASQYHYEGVAEGKTGYTSDAWNTLVTTAERDNMKLICVVLRCQGAAAAYNDTTKLFNYGFENYNLLKPLKNLSLSDVAADSDISVGEISNLETLNPVYHKDYTVLAPSNVTENDITVTLTEDGQEAGTWGALHLSYDGQEIGKANIYYDKDSEQAAIMTDDHSTKAKTISKVPFILTGVIVVLIIFIISMIVSIIRRR